MVILVATISLIILCLLVVALTVTAMRTALTGKHEEHVKAVLLKGFIPWAVISTIALVLA